MFESEDDLMLHIKPYYKIIPYFESVKFLTNSPSPWSLLRILIKDVYVGGDYVFEDGGSRFHVVNEEISYYLEALGNCIEAGSIDLHKFLKSKYYQPFSLPRSEVISGQGKLFFSLLYFVLDQLKKGANKVVEVGGGEGFGGENHVAVANVLHDHGKKCDFVMYDPLLIHDNRKIHDSSFAYRQRWVEGTEKFDCPVFCDIYDDANWVRIQDQLKCSVIMKKRGKSESCVFPMIQPYHSERRDYCNRQLVYLLKGLKLSFPGMDSCVNCALWKSLIIEFDLDPGSIISNLNFLGVSPCSRYVGAGTYNSIKRRDTFGKLERSELLSIVNKVKVRTLPVKVDDFVLTDWDKIIFEKLIDEGHRYCEVSDGKESNLVRTYPRMFSDTGTKFFRSVKLFNDYIGDCLIDGVVTECEQVMIKYEDRVLYNYVRGGRMLLRLSGSYGTVKFINVGSEFVNKYELINLPCCHSSCVGLWCTYKYRYGCLKNTEGKVCFCLISDKGGEPIFSDVYTNRDHVNDVLTRAYISDCVGMNNHFVSQIISYGLLRVSQNEFKYHNDRFIVSNTVVEYIRSNGSVLMIDDHLKLSNVLADLHNIYSSSKRRYGSPAYSRRRLK